MVPTLLGLSVGMGCAHQPATEPDAAINAQRVEMASRFDEMEQTNERLNVRIEELEDQLFLLQDMTESNRIALRRHGYMRRGTYLTQNSERANGDDSRARAPGPTPESYSRSSNAYGAPMDDGYEARQAQRSGRRVQRIELSEGHQNRPPAAPSQQPQAAPTQSPASSGDDTMEEVTITDAEFRNFVGDDGRRPAPASSRAPRTRKGRAQAPVTDEKLNTHKKSSPPAASKSGDSTKKSPKNSLSIYKTALAEYRRGSYAQALAGFKRFLAADPNPNYVDNGLYWIGECHYGLGDYKQATTYFTRVMREQPDGNKVPDSMLKMSLAYERMDNLSRTRELLEKLADRYPTTHAGRLGAQKLAELPDGPLRN